MVDVTEEKDHMCEYCIHKNYCFVAFKKKEYCGNCTQERKEIWKRINTL